LIPRTVSLKTREQQEPARPRRWTMCRPWPSVCAVRWARLAGLLARGLAADSLPLALAVVDLPVLLAVAGRCLILCCDGRQRAVQGAQLQWDKRLRPVLFHRGKGRHFSPEKTVCLAARSYAPRRGVSQPGLSLSSVFRPFFSCLMLLPSAP
jgi:hypothetical protein